jgi:hypothetical protein
MIGLLIAVLVVLLMALVIWASGGSASTDIDPEHTFRTAVDLHRIRRGLDADVAKADIRRNARDIERQGLREVDDEP